MKEIAELVGYFAVLFAASMGAAWLIASLKLSLRKAPDPEPGAGLRIRGTGGMYRTRVLEVRGPFWVLNAPLMRDFYVPLHVGEMLTVEWPLTDGVMFFKTVIRARDAATHTLIIDRPAGGRKTERRGETRVSDPSWAPVGFEGVASTLVDVSPSGAKIETTRPTVVGERVRLDFPWIEAPVFGWVLDASLSSKAGAQARIRFEERLASLPA
jgi:hypothetical protein